MKVFGQKRSGIYSPHCYCGWPHQVMANSRTNKVKEQFYAIAVECRVTYLNVDKVMVDACEILFAKE